MHEICKCLVAAAVLSMPVLWTMTGSAEALVIHADSTASIRNEFAGDPGITFLSGPSAVSGASHELNGHAFEGETRVVSLFDLSARGPSGSATLLFDVRGFTGGELQRYDVLSFTNASGAIEVSDFEAGPATLELAGFDPTDDAPFAVDITGLFNASLGTVLGFRVQPDFQGLSGVSDDHFDAFNFRIRTAGDANAVPEPGTLALLGLGLACVGLVGRRRRRSGAHSAAI